MSQPAFDRNGGLLHDHPLALFAWRQLRAFTPLLRDWHWRQGADGLAVTLTFDDDQSAIDLFFADLEIVVTTTCFRLSPDSSVLTWLLVGRGEWGWRAGVTADPDDSTLLTGSLRRHFRRDVLADLPSVVWEARLESQLWRRKLLQAWATQEERQPLGHLP